MNRIFRRGNCIKVPDGTRVFPFLNPTDSSNDLPVGLFDGVSIAQGEIDPMQCSKIQMHPLVTVVVWVVRGRLNLKMKDPDQADAYVLELGAEHAAVALPGTFFQLINPADELCRVLYIVSPPYVYLQDSGTGAVYDDALVFDIDWDALAGQAWRPPAIPNCASMRAARTAAIEELANRKGTAKRAD